MAVTGFRGDSSGFGTPTRSGSRGGDGFGGLANGVAVP